jgi:hypothetical protein
VAVVASSAAVIGELPAVVASRVAIVADLGGGGYG